MAGLTWIKNWFPKGKRAAKKRAQAQQLLRFREQVASTYPQVLDPDTPDFTRVSLLRCWAWSHIRYPANGAALLDGDPLTWYLWQAPAIFQAFAEDRGGVLCGGAAFALRRVYEAFGFRAWQLNSGVQDGQMTHMTTLVEIFENRAPMLCLQDAYFNYSIVDRVSRRPVDYFALLERLRSGDHESLWLEEPDFREIKPWPAMLVGATAVEHRPARIAAASWPVLETHYSVTRLPDGSQKFVSPRTQAKFLTRCCQTREGNPAWYLAWLVQQGYPANLIYLYLYPFEIHGPGGAELLHKAQRTLGSQRSSR